MFGYATDETEEAMPLTLQLAHQLNEKLHAMRRSGELTWVRPDSKSQVSYTGAPSIRLTEDQFNCF